jgi:hypothetical protein
MADLITKVCIVGGGNAAQAFAAILPNKGVSCNMWCGFGDEAERINKGVSEQGGMKVHWADDSVIMGKPDKISKDPADVVPECNVLIMPLPSFAYPSVFEQLKPHLKPGTYVGITPGQGGFDWVARNVLGEELMKSLNLFAIMPMPLNCRITDFGKQVHVQVLKKKYKVGALPASATDNCCKIVSHIFSAQAEGLGHLLAATMYPINAIIHPQRTYEICQKWRPGGKPLPENPLFYESMNTASAGLMDLVNTELQMIGEVITEKSGVKLDIPHIKDFLGWVYEDDKPDLTSTASFFATAPAYKGFRSPLKQVEGGFEPDFANRYFTEDIPLGLCIYKGIADIVDFDTPVLDMIVYWAQGHMKKEYIVAGKLTGKDVGETNAPQRFNVNTLDMLLGK